MPIKIKLNPTATPAAPVKPDATIELRISKTLAGNYLIKDHRLLDIVVMPTEGRVAAVAKPRVADIDTVYEHQKDLMDSLFRSGIVEYDTIQGALSFGVLESYFKTDAQGVDPVQVVLLEIERYIKQTASDGWEAEEYDKNIEDRFTDPNSSDSTALGSVKPEQDEPYALSTVQGGTYGFSAYGYYY